MERQKYYENTLVEIVNHLKGLHTILSSVMLDTAALRQTVLTGHADIAEYADHVQAGAQIGKPLLESALRSYDQIITKLKDVQQAEADAALDGLDSPVLN